MSFKTANNLLKLLPSTKEEIDKFNKSIVFNVTKITLIDHCLENQHKKLK